MTASAPGYVRVTQREQEQFRADYPEFGSGGTYQTSQIEFWFRLAYSLLNANRWGAQLDFGAELFVAHNIALEAGAIAAAAGGAAPGTQVGPVSSKSVDKVSVSYDTGNGIELGAGHWNTTTYGTRFIRLVRMFGAGPVQIGIGHGPAGSAAWPGPDTTPGFTNFG
jgi:hypothetical protein